MRVLRIIGAVGLVLVLAGLFVKPVHEPVSVPVGEPMLLSSQASHEILDEGRVLFFNMQLEAAEQRFNELAERADGEVAASFHLALTTLLKSVITDDEVYYDRFDERYDRLSDALDEAEDSLWKTYLSAEARLMRTIMLAKQNRVIRAALTARGAHNRFQRAASSEHPDFAEAYKGVGLFNIALGSLPSGYQRVLSILGYRGSIEQGLAQLERAAAESQYNQEEATAYLAFIDVILKYEPAHAVERTRLLAEQYPESPLFGWIRAFILLEDRQVHRAREAATQAVQRGQQPGYFFVDYAEYYMGEALFRLNRFGDAATYYRRYMARHKGPALRALAHLRTGHALEMEGRRDEALIFYRRVRAERDFDADEMAYREAQRRLSTPLDRDEKHLLRGINAFYAGQYNLSRALLQSLLGSTTEGVAARARYYVAQSQYAQGRFDVAAEHFREARANPGRQVDGIAPWSAFYLGQIQQRRGNIQDAEELYKQALAYSTPFDYHQWLEQRVAVAREAYNK